MKGQRKPALTRKVLRGLNAMAAVVEAGDLLDGDLAADKQDVHAALRWVRGMVAHQEPAAEGRAL